MKKSVVYALIAVAAAVVLITSLILVFGGNDKVPSNVPTDATPSTTLASSDITTTVSTAVTTTITTTTTTPPATHTIKMTFAGDNVLASYKNEQSASGFPAYFQSHEPSYFLDKVRHIFEDDDFTIVNLENVLTDRVLSETPRDYEPAFWFYSPTSHLEVLTCSSVEAVSLENNHTYDYGYEGYSDTINTVTNAGLPYGDNNTIMYLEKDGFTIAVICHGLWSEWQATPLINQIHAAEAQSDYQVVFFHGGEEKIHTPDTFKVDCAHRLVDAGADLVIGSHPHVLQPREVYNGVEIVYSIGNFCYGGSSYPENRTIIYQMELTIDSETNIVTASQSNIIPCYVYTGGINNYQPAVIENEAEKQLVLDFMDGKADSPL